MKHPADFSRCVFYARRDCLCGRTYEAYKRRVVARTINIDQLNEWVVEVDGVRRARFIGYDAVWKAARCANEWRRQLGIGGGPGERKPLQA